MNGFKTLLSVFAATMALASPSTARALEPPQASHFEVGASLGVSAFVQEGHAPPICCGERDDWTILGPRLGLMAGWLPGDHFRLALHIDFFAGGTDAQDGRRDIVSLGNRLALDLVLGARKALRFHIGAEAGIEYVAGDFRDADSVINRTELLFVFGAHTGVVYPLSGALGVGIELRYVRGFVSGRWDGLATVVWSL